MALKLLLLESFSVVPLTMRYQRTIQKTVSCLGKGLHSGARASLELSPAPVGHGIVFVQRSLEGIVRIKVEPTKVVGTDLSTTLGENGAVIQTVEHLLSALAGLRITNLLVKLDSQELPIMDGSSAPFVRLIQQAGMVDQKEPQSFIRMTRSLEVRDGQKWISIHPADRFSIGCTIRYEHPLIKEQRFEYQGGEEEFSKSIAPARTFGFLREVEALWRRGLARGGSIENAIVLGPESVLNKGGLRFPDEFVRHKILDLIGDLSLLGLPIIGRIDAFCPGHQLNSQLIDKIFSTSSSWELAEESRTVSTDATAPQKNISVPA